MPDTTTLHGTCVSIGGRGVLILGAPGAGKSDLALRLIDQPGAGLSGAPREARLVADDQVTITRGADMLVATTPAALRGKFEIRGFGIVELPVEANAPLALAVRLTESAAIERLPESPDKGFEILGVSLPMVLIDGALASAPARVRAALDWLREP